MFLNVLWLCDIQLGVSVTGTGIIKYIWWLTFFSKYWYIFQKTLSYMNLTARCFTFARRRSVMVSILSLQASK